MELDIMETDLKMTRINLEKEIEETINKSIIFNTDVISKVSDVELRELIEKNSSLSEKELILKGVLVDIISRMYLKTEIILTID